MERIVIVIVYRTHLSEDDVLSVQPRGGHSAHEELGPVGVLARVRHRQHASLVVDQLRLTECGNPQVIDHVMFRKKKKKQGELQRSINKEQWGHAHDVTLQSAARVTLDA